METSKVYYDAIENAKQCYYRDKISNSDQCKLFKFIDGLFRPQGVSTLPTHTSSLDLANRFMAYFSGKVNNLRSGMESPTIQLSRASLPVPSTCTFSEFGPVTQETVRTVILNSPPKSCFLDPLPTSHIIPYHTYFS